MSQLLRELEDGSEQLHDLCILFNLHNKIGSNLDSIRIE
jgi:hypothetical protein